MKKILTIANNTFRESVRSKILFSIVFFAILILVVSSVFGVVTIGDKVKVLKDFGLFSLNLFGIAYVVITGSALLQKELTKKTVYNILSKPILRRHFIIGKYLGMLATLLAMYLIMTILLMAFIAWYEELIDWNMLPAIYSIFLQVAIICALVILISTVFVTPFLSGAIAFGLFLIGRSAETIWQVIEKINLPGLTGQLTESLFYLIPQLYKIDISNRVVYNYGVSSDLLIWNSAYSFGYIAVCLIIGGYFFSRREFN